jgi:hypothetical protein
VTMCAVTAVSFLRSVFFPVAAGLFGLEAVRFTGALVNQVAPQGGERAGRRATGLSRLATGTGLLNVTLAVSLDVTNSRGSCPS